ncbi:MAG TPA: DUF1778 domain-containing protein [Planctomycetaceae bacterium]
MAKRKAARKAASKRPGRPPKEESERLGVPVPVAFTEDQVELIDEAAKIAGVKRSELIREAAVERAQRIVDREAKRKPE